MGIEFEAHIRKKNISFVQYESLTRINDAFQLENADVLAVLSKNGHRATLSIEGYTKIVYKDKTYTRFCELPEEAQAVLKTHPWDFADMPLYVYENPDFVLTCGEEKRIVSAEHFTIGNTYDMLATALNEYLTKQQYPQNALVPPTSIDFIQQWRRNDRSFERD